MNSSSLFSIMINTNVGLICVGVTNAAILILCVLVYVNGRRVSLNVTFCVFCLLTIAWSISDFLLTRVSNTSVLLWALRIHLFIAVWHSFTFYIMSRQFPQQIILKRTTRFTLIIFLVLISIITLSRYTFEAMPSLAPVGHVTIPSEGPGIVIFSITTIIFIIAGFKNLLSKYRLSSDIQKKQVGLVLTGSAISISLVILFNLILPVVFRNTEYILFASFFFIPYILFISFSILRYQLFNMRLIAIEIAMFTVWFAIITHALSHSNNSQQLEIECVFLIVTVILGTLLIQSMIGMDRQRKLIEKLTTELQEASAQLRQVAEYLDKRAPLASSKNPSKSIFKTNIFK